MPHAYFSFLIVLGVVGAGLHIPLWAFVGDRLPDAVETRSGGGCAVTEIPPEALMARSCRMLLSEVTADTLELLPQISEARAAAIIDRRGEIRELASALGPARACQAFERVHGIGRSLGLTLCKSIDPLH